MTTPTVSAAAPAPIAAASTTPIAGRGAPAPSFAGALPSGIDPALRTAAASGPVDAVVFLAPPEQARQGFIDAMAAVELLPLGTERKQAAYDVQHKAGSATLEANRATFQQLVADGKASGFDELWSVNAVRVRGASLDALERLAGPGVIAVVPDATVAVPQVLGGSDDAVRGATEVPLGNFDPVVGADRARAADAGDDVWMDWGVDRMRASEAWKQGITGAGIVIGSLDTGVATQHPVLRSQYRGTQADGTQQHDYNWKDVVKELPYEAPAPGAPKDAPKVPGKLPDGTTWDPANDAPNGTSKVPIDLNGHGTHTSGSAVGADGQHFTGVAPDAKLIVARGLGNAGGSMFDLMSAMEWFMAPTKVDGSEPRPDMAPDVVTNSWGGAAIGNPFLWMSLRAWRRAGIVPVFASGNARDAQPGQVAVPGMYPETITVGATDLDEKRAWFSMYGPSPYADGPKPDVGAPGHWTYSSLPDGTVRDVFPVDGREAPASGTSMATPHVAGAVALFMQANPGASYDDVLAALRSSGTLADAPTDELGYGRVQVDRLITPETIDPSATRTDQARVDELMAQVAKAKVYNEGIRKPGPPTAVTPPEETPEHPAEPPQPAHAA